MRSYTTTDGFTLRIFSTMYLDWGLEISYNDETLYYNPHCISSDCVGFHDTSDEDEILNELLSIRREIVKDNEYLARRILSVMHDLEAIREEKALWSDGDWQEYLECEADSLVECFVENWKEHVNE